tara:strand:+ start:889 stop:1482 length:594 start_codon:yes stop_codon:yes gene_type:complete
MLIQNMRKNLGIILFLSALILLSSLHIFYFLQEAKKTKYINNKTINKIDGVVVLTGDKYRIAKGIELLRDYPSKRLLISGVNKNINPNDIMKEFPNHKKLFQCCIEIGEDSKNTFENILETYAWMRNNNYTSIIIVTSDYHIPRVKLEMNRFIDNQQIFYEAVRTSDSEKISKFKKISLEYIKYLRTYLSIKVGLNA